MMKTGLTVAVLVALLTAAAATGLFIWRELDGVEMSAHGWIALTLGAVITILVGGGLMALVFFSNRHGYDDRMNRLVDREQD